VTVQDGLGVLADPGLGGGVAFPMEGPGSLPEVPAERNGCGVLDIGLYPVPLQP